ncbi:hypothetical protein ASG48_11750 [Aurantimonas sp. Leaf443]|nr:hypothetical protein ASG48_11750 [Aurantimonas sp. Leaf443]
MAELEFRNLQKRFGGTPALTGVGFAMRSGDGAPLPVVTKANVQFDGGPDNAFDPQNGYRDACKALWGVS